VGSSHGEHPVSSPLAASPVSRADTPNRADTPHRVDINSKAVTHLSKVDILPILRSKLIPSRTNSSRAIPRSRGTDRRRGSPPQRAAVRVPRSASASPSPEH